MNVLHVPTITKNLVSIRQIVDQGMQVRFTHLGCFIEEEGQVIVQGRRDGRMFILDTNDVGTAMFAKGQKSSWISTCGISGLAMSTTKGFKTCNRNKLSSVCRNSVAKRPKFVKPAS